MTSQIVVSPGDVLALVAVGGLLTLAGLLVLGRVLGWHTDDESGCDHEFGPVRKLTDDFDGPYIDSTAETVRADFFELMEARCRNCGERARMTYNVRNAEFPHPTDVEDVVYTEDGRETRKYPSDP